MAHAEKDLSSFITKSLASGIDDYTLFNSLAALNYLSINNAQLSDCIISLLNAHYENSLSRIIDYAFLFDSNNKRVYFSTKIMSFAFISSPKTLTLYFRTLEKFFGRRNPSLITPNLLINIYKNATPNEWEQKCLIYADYWLRLWSPNQSFIHQDFFDSFGDLFEAIITHDLPGITSVYKAFTHIGGCIDEIFPAHKFDEELNITNQDILLFLHKPEIASFCLHNNVYHVLKFINIPLVMKEFPEYFIHA